MKTIESSYVYWIRLKSHTDIFTEGYVGITCLDVQHRFKLHKQAKPRNGKRPTRVINAIKKYGDELICETILAGSREYCLYIENKLRSEQNIGWNLAVGGIAPLLGRKMTEEEIELSASKRRGAKRTPDMCKVNSDLAIERSKQYIGREWHHPYSNKLAWSFSVKIYEVYTFSKNFGRRSISKLFGIGPDSAMKVVNKIKSGWIPLLDSDYINWLHKYKEEFNGT